MTVSREKAPSRRMLRWGASGAALAVALHGSAHAQLAQLRAAVGLPSAAMAVPPPRAAAIAPNGAGMVSASLRALQHQARAQQAVSLAAQANAAARAAALAATPPAGFAASGAALPIGNGLSKFEPAVDGAGRPILDPQTGAQLRRQISVGLQQVANPTTAAADPTGLRIWEGADNPVESSIGGATTVTIRQNQERALLSWDTFNIGRETSLVFEQKINDVDQTNWVVLNRVVGGFDATGQRTAGAAPSQILGAIRAPGTVLVLNQNGILFGASSQVNVHSLVASSLEVGALSRTTGASFGIQSVPTTIAERSNTFLQSGLLNSGSTTLLSGMAVQAGDEAEIWPTVEGDVRVDSGARIDSAGGGFVIIAAPTVVNAGEISAPTGQVSLQSGRVIDARPSSGAADSLDPDVRGLIVRSTNTRAFGGASSVADSVENRATGIIDAPLGYVSLGSSYAGSVDQSGVLSSTTSVARNGKISLTGADVRLLPGSTISITPDRGAETIPQSAASIAQFKTSKIEIGNRLVSLTDGASTALTPATVTIGANALIYAPGADVRIGASPGIATNAEGQPFSAPSRIVVADGAVIDVSGVKDFVVPASRNSILIDPAKRNELRDTPNYRDAPADGAFSLNGATVYVDPRLSGVRADGVAWVGSPLIEAASYYAQVGVTAAELMTRGGNVTFGVRASAGGNAADAPSVSLARGATVDFSGGWVRYEDGFVQSSKLITGDGRIVDIGSADPNDRFVGILNGFTETQDRFGFSRTFSNSVLLGNGFERGYVEGRDAGALTIKASTASLEATLYGDAFAGQQQISGGRQGSGLSSIYGDVRAVQRAPSELPMGGLLNFQAMSLLSPGDNKETVTGGGDIVISAGEDDAPAADPGVTVLPAGYLSGAGLGQVALATSGSVRFLPGSALTLANGGALTVDAGRTIRFDGDVSIASGTIRARTYDIAGGSIFDGGDDKPAFLGADDAIPRLYDIVVNGTLSTRGRWVNDLLVADGAYLGGAYAAGGAVSLTVAPRVAVAIGEAPTDAADLSGSIFVNPGAAIDVSAGGHVTTGGDLVLDAKGGDVSLVNETTYFQIAGLPNPLPSSPFDNGLSGFRVTPDGQHAAALNPRAINATVAIAEGTIRGHGFSGGGTFSLVTPDLNFSNEILPVGTLIPLDFIPSAGFANYRLTSWNTRLLPDLFANNQGGNSALLSTESVRIHAGEVLNLTQSLLPSLLDTRQADALRGLATGAALGGTITAAVPVEAWDRRGVNLAFGGLTELMVDAGGRIEGDAGSAITTAKLLNAGTIRLVGGTITQSQSLPASYLGTGRPALGIRGFGEIFGAADADGAFDELAPNALGITASGDPGSEVLSNRDLVARQGLDRSVYLLGELDAGDGIRLTAGSMTDLSGASIRNPRAALLPDRSRQLVTGRMIDGGTIEALGSFVDPSRSLFSSPRFGIDPYRLAIGNAPASQRRAGLTITAEARSSIDISGAADNYDVETAPNSFTPAAAWSDGGRLALGAGGVLAGTVDADGGAPSAIGGTLEWLDPVLRQSVGARPPLNRVSADMVEAAGFDTFIARRSITSVGDVTLNLGRAFYLTSLPFNGDAAAEAYRVSFGAGGDIAVAAPYIRLESLQQTITPAGETSVGNAGVALSGKAIDIAGAVLFDRSIADVRLNASGDVRLIGVQPIAKALGVGSNLANSLSGQLLVAGDLTIRAAQVYPTTGTGNLQQLIDAQRAGQPLDVDAFVVASIGAGSTIRFERSSETAPAAPYSAGGNLLVQAANIEQAGVLRVPIGKLVLGSNTPLGLSLSELADLSAPATQSVRLEAGSMTSVSAGGLNIPYGTTTDLIEYFFTPTSDARLTAPPAAEFRIAGDSVAADAGAIVDLSGGGDLYAYEFASGTGGSRDVLSRFNSDEFSGNDGLQYPDGRQVYAIVPLLKDAAAAPFDPIYSADYADLYSATGAGRSVYLEGGPGVAAGWYTLLPARYALLPGGLRVIENVGETAGAVGASVKLRDGSLVVGGRYGVAGTGFEQSVRRTFTVQDQDTFRKFSRIELTSASQTFAGLATRDGLAAPRLPSDAARLVLNPLTSLAVATAINAAPANGGRGAQVDLTGQAISIVSPGAPAAPGIRLTTADIANLNAASLLIGALRTDLADGTTSLAVASETIGVANDAAHPLTAPEIVLAVDGAGSSIAIADGAAIVATGTLEDKRSGNYLIPTEAGSAQTGAGGIIRVANGPERLVERTGDIATANTLADASVTVGAAALDGSALLIDSSRDLAISSAVALSGDAIALGGDDVNFASALPGQRGFLITPELATALATVPRLTISSQSVIGFAPGAYQFGDLRLSSRGIRLIGPGDEPLDTAFAVTIRAADLALANPGTDRGACTLAGRLACGAGGGTLALEADAIRFGGGALHTYGFDGAVRLAAPQGMYVEGRGSLDVGGADLLLETPFLGDRAVTTTADNRKIQPSLQLATAGAVTIANPSGAAIPAPAGAPGGSLAIGTIDRPVASVSIDGTQLRATAGALDIRATGTIAASGSASLATPGYSQLFGDEGDAVRVSAPGGALRLTSLAGDIRLGAATRLSVGGGDGPAGSLSLSAARGLVALGGTIDASAPAGRASLALDIGRITDGAGNPAFDFAAFLAGAGRQFNGDFSVRTGEGDLAVGAGRTLRADAVRLAADGGRIDVAGTIDTAGVNGGDISLFGNVGVTLGATAKLDAHADGYAATDSRQASGGDVALGTDGAGALLVEAGATIDVAARRGGARLIPQLRKDPVTLNDVTTYNYAEADAGGRVSFRAPIMEQPGADSVAIRYAGTIVGADEIGVEAFKRFELGTLAADPRYTGVSIDGAGQAVLDLNADAAGKANVLAADAPGTLVDFVRNFDISGATGLGNLASVPQFRARPGMELDYAGDIVLASNWNLGAGVVDIPGAVAAGAMAPSSLGNGLFQVTHGREAELFDSFTDLLYRVGGRAGGAAGVLTLRAGGNLDLRGSITDGFFTFADQTDPRYLSYQLGGGDRSYRPVVNIGCGTAASGRDCSIISEFFVDPNSRAAPLPPSAAVSVNLVRIARGSDNVPDAEAPYNPGANAPGALGAQADGAGDPIGSADLFPLLADGSPADSSSLRFVGGADLASADMLRVDPAANGSVIASGEVNYTVQPVRGSAIYAGGLQLRLDQGLAFEDSYFADPAEFLAGFGDATGTEPEFVPNLYTRLSFAAAPAGSEEFLRGKALAFFAADSDRHQFFGPEGQPNLVAAPLELMAQFLQSIDAEFSAGIASGSFGYAPVQEAALTRLPNRNAYAGALIRTGTGTIDLAAAGDVDLRGGPTPTFRGEANRATSRSNPNGAQVGGVAVYTAGHRIVPGLVQATVAGSGQILAVDPAAYAITADYKATRPLAPYFDGVLQANPVYASGGGSIGVVAGRDVLGRRDVWSEAFGANEASDPDYDVMGAADQRWRVGTVGTVPGQNVASPATNIRINPQLFSAGVGTLGGGDIAIRAGRDISDLTIAADTSVTTADVADTRALMTFGGGNVAMAAGRDLLGGQVDVASGTGSLAAGGAVRSAGLLRLEAQGDGSRPLAENLLRLRVSDASIAVSAGRGVALAGIAALGARRGPFFEDRLANLNAAGFYSPVSGIEIAASGDVTIANRGAGLTTDFTFDNVRADDIGVVLPGSLRITSLGGDIDLSAGDMVKQFLYPSAQGQLTLLAGGDIAPATIVMDDGDPSLLPGALSAFQFDGSNITAGRGFGFPAVLPTTDDATRRLYHNQRPTHAGDSEPVRLVAGGNINQLTLSLPKQARITAGNDIVDMMFFGQNLAAGDVTRVVAGRDIVATSRIIAVGDGSGAPLALPTLQGNNFVLGGPGALFVEAGRDLGPFLNSAVVGDPASSYAGGILTVGDENNPWLGATGAKAYAMFGVAKGADYDALRDYYVDPANVAALDGDLFEQITDVNGNAVPDRTRPIYATILTDWMAANASSALVAAYGTTQVGADRAFATFKELPPLVQRQFLLDKVYFNELAQTSRPDGPSYLQYVRGYRAVDTLFPASRGYTANDLSGRSNGGGQIATGNLDLRLAAIETARGGDVTILGPGGRVLGGSVVRTSEQAARRGFDGAGSVNTALFAGGRRAPADNAGALPISAIPSGFEGVLTLRGGAVRGFVDDDFLLNQSRLFTQAGGDITLWSSNGDLNAGQGPKSAANFPPIVVRFDPNGFAEVNSAGSVSGAGIAALQPTPDVRPSDVTLIAPVGTVDAGDAGVRAGGNVFVAAAQVANADNFKVGGKAFGVPGAASVDVAANTSGDAAAAAAAQVANSVNPGAGRQNDDRTRITVDVLGFSGDPQDDPCKRPDAERPANCPTT